jgi:hypothetical protein
VSAEFLGMCCCVALVADTVCMCMHRAVICSSGCVISALV